MIYAGDLFDVLPTLEAESLDACVTDPPYGIGFMGKGWDSFAPTRATLLGVPNKTIDADNPNVRGRARSPASSPSAVEYDRSLKGHHAFQTWTEHWARQVFRVLKPGAYLLVCGAPRSFHRMTCGLEDAGFEIRDCLSWLYGQGFPKSLNVSKAIDRAAAAPAVSATSTAFDGCGTALKPGWEPIILARKPLIGTMAENAVIHGTGGLNINACRVGNVPAGWHGNSNSNSYGGFSASHDTSPECHTGRWPANVLLDAVAAMALDRQTGDDVGGLDEGGASRFYYVAKPSREERDMGCDDLRPWSGGEATNRQDGSIGVNHPRSGAGGGGGARNFHPTVKPVELMRWLVKLVTPINGVVLDPFMGSGTTGVACRYEQRDFVGIEREAEYVEIATRRIAAVAPLFGSYDDHQVNAPLVTCKQCGRALYMTVPADICTQCQPSLFIREDE